MTDPGYAIAFFDRLGRQLVDLLWLPSLEALLLGVLVWALLLSNRIFSPRIRHFLLLLVLAKLVCAALLPWPGPFEVPWAPAMRAAEPAPGGPGNLTNHIYAGVALVWIAFAGIGLVRVVSAVIVLTRRKGRAVPVAVPRVTALFERCLAESGLKRNVTLRISDEFEGPALIAVGRPVVVIPSWCILELSETELRQVLLHELAHYARGDHLTVLLVQFARIFFFFHPAVWYAAHRIGIEAERACDAAVVRASSHPERYASTLIKVAGSKVRTHWQAVLELARSASVVAIRIRDVLGSAVDRKQNAFISLLAVGFCTVIAVMPLFRTSLHAPADKPFASQPDGSATRPQPVRVDPVRKDPGAAEHGGSHASVVRSMASVPGEDVSKILVDGRPAPRRSMAVMMTKPHVGSPGGAIVSPEPQKINRAALGPSVSVLAPSRTRSSGTRHRHGRIEVQGVGQTRNALYDPGAVSLSAGYFLTPVHQFGGVFSIRQPNDPEAFDNPQQSSGAAYGGNLLRARKLAGFGNTALREGILDAEEEQQVDRITTVGAFYRYNLPVPGGSFTPFLGCGTGLEIRPRNGHTTMVNAGVGLRYFWERHVALVVQAAYRKELGVVSPPHPEMTLGFSAIF